MKMINYCWVIIYGTSCHEHSPLFVQLCTLNTLFGKGCQRRLQLSDQDFLMIHILFIPCDCFHTTRPTRKKMVMNKLTHCFFYLIYIFVPLSFLDEVKFLNRSEFEQQNISNTFLMPNNIMYRLSMYNANMDSPFIETFKKNIFIMIKNKNMYNIILYCTV